MLPLVAVLAVALGAPPTLTIASVVIGTAAGLVRALWLVRWPVAVPELARRYAAADGPDAGATRASIEVTFVTLHRLLGGPNEERGWAFAGDRPDRVHRVVALAHGLGVALLVT